MCNDLNGCISNLLVDYNDYYDSLTWNSNYLRSNTRDITQNNIDSRYHYIQSGEIRDIDNPISRPKGSNNHYYFCQKDSFNTTYGISNLRPIIEFRE